MARGVNHRLHELYVQQHHTGTVCHASGQLELQLLYMVNGHHTGYNAPKNISQIIVYKGVQCAGLLMCIFFFCSSFCGGGNLEANDFMVGHMTPFMCDAKFKLLCRFKHDINIGQDVCWAPIRSFWLHYIVDNVMISWRYQVLEWWSTVNK